MRKLAILSAASLFTFHYSAPADLTIVQKVEGAAQNGDVTVKIKGDKERIDAPSQSIRIIDGKSGEMADLMSDRKSFIKISAAQIGKAAESVSLSADKKSAHPNLFPPVKRKPLTVMRPRSMPTRRHSSTLAFGLRPSIPAQLTFLSKCRRQFRARGSRATWACQITLTSTAYPSRLSSQLGTIRS